MTVNTTNTYTISSDESDVSHPVFTIGVTSRLTNTSVHALRMYEEKGLLIPYKTRTNRRLYSKADVERIQCIRHHIDEEGLNIAGIKVLLAMVPCWDIRPCSHEDRMNCAAFTSVSEPCWEAEPKGNECEHANCRECHVYQLGQRCANVKQLYQEIYIRK